MKVFTPTKIIFSALFVSYASTASAKTYLDPSSGWKQCAEKNLKQKNQRASTFSVENNSPSPDAIYLGADQGVIRLHGTSDLSGNVIIQKNDTLFNADKATFNRENQIVNAQGNVIFSSSGSVIKSQSIEYDIKNQKGKVKQAEYEVGLRGSHGKSDQVELIDNNTLQLSNATYTTCPISNNSWHFASSNIKLDKKKQIGTAKNVTFKVGNTPIFYFPWLDFPINNQRKSGFLAPRIRLQSNAGISLPYYFNLAPNYDATTTLSTLRGRGLKLDTEFRYLSDKHFGIINYNIIPNDSLYDSKRRDYYKIKHLSKLNKNTQIKLKAEGVSDKDYFNDLSLSLEESTRSSLQRRLEISREEGNWTSSVAFESYQILDSKNAPYSRLPEIKLGYHRKSKPQEFKVGLDSELVYFDKNNSTTGTRADLKLQLSKRWGNKSWFIKPKLSLQHTSYSLNDKKNTTIHRSLPTFTFDSGLFFDRKIKLKNNLFTQTLEPRLFYTTTPYRNQNNIPIFDTAKIDFSATNQLFSENRFVGKDRVADTNQLTFAVTSRIQDRNSGKELFKASIGQTLSFRDKKVTLPGGNLQRGRRSDFVLELSGRLNDRFRVSSTGLLSHDKKNFSNYEFRLNYHDNKKRLANISYRKLNTELKQLTFSGSVPINDKWSMVASVDQDMENNRNLQTLLGVEYQDCCWKTRIVAKRYLTADNKNYETPIFIEFEFKGLGSLGTGASREIKENIYGYDDFE